jgi:hypothetical protein
MARQSSKGAMTNRMERARHPSVRQVQGRGYDMKKVWPKASIKRLAAALKK